MVKTEQILNLRPPLRRRVCESVSRADPRAVAKLRIEQFGGDSSFMQRGGDDPVYARKPGRGPRLPRRARRESKSIRQFMVMHQRFAAGWTPYNRQRGEPGVTKPDRFRLEITEAQGRGRPAVKPK